MFRDAALALIAILVISRAAAFVEQQPAVNATSANVPSPTPIDPAAIVFAASDLGLVLHAVKPGSVADYEAAIVALQEALASSDDPETREVAKSWRVYKAQEVDAKANPLYVHVLQPPVKAVDYRPSLWLDKLLEGAPPDLMAKYRDAFATAPSKLALTTFADMSVMPVVKPGNATPSAPTGNASPTAPASGNRSPSGTSSP